MTISVIIPVYNEQKTIEKCINSLLNQTLKPGQIILIDDGSTDKTISIIKKLKSQHSLVKLIIQKHQGPATARNKGASQAKTQILVFVDADMEFNKNFIKDLTNPIRKNKSKGSWSSNELVKNWDNVWARCWNYNNGLPDKKMISYTSGQKKVFRAILKSEFDKVKGFDSIGYTDDWTLAAKLGYQPKATRAEFYHYNPDNLNQIFYQAVWIGKRKYKLAKLGTFIAILRANAGFSLIIGILKAVKYKTIKFIIFKLVYDLGISFGAISSLKGKKY